MFIVILRTFNLPLYAVVSVFQILEGNYLKRNNLFSSVLSIYIYHLSIFKDVLRKTFYRKTGALK